jgi:BarA-like signal transduction histidine kinase
MAAADKSTQAAAVATVKGVSLGLPCNKQVLARKLF